jgi:hypothetical protein
MLRTLWFLVGLMIICGRASGNAAEFRCKAHDDTDLTQTMLCDKVGCHRRLSGDVFEYRLIFEMRCRELSMQGLGITCELHDARGLLLPNVAWTWRVTRSIEASDPILTLQNGYFELRVGSSDPMMAMQQVRPVSIPIAFS